MYRGRRRSAARMLAPLALLLSVVAVVVVVQASSTGSDDSKGDSSNGTATEPSNTGDTTEQPRRVRPNYTVKLNDTLGLIAEKTGVSVERIQALNPELDPQNLIVGQRIKLRE
jgi:LysM repeat protein